MDVRQLRQDIERYLATPPEIVFRWTDPGTGATGWTVINSLRNGAAGGGTRMSPSVSEQELTELAKIMEIKFTVTGPAIGGAKSGIRFSRIQQTARKREVLRKFYRAIRPLLSQCYGTGGDLNVSEPDEVIPILEELGIYHPQEGIVRGYTARNPVQQAHLIFRLRHGTALEVTHPDFRIDTRLQFKVDELITGFGVAESVRHVLELWYQENLEGKKVLVQGFGNVGGAAAYYLAHHGAHIVGIMDAHTVLVNEKGMGKEEIAHLLETREGNCLNHPAGLPRESAEHLFWSCKADIFIPAAASYLVSREHLEQLRDHGVRVIASGANIPFQEDQPLYGSLTELADRWFSLIPDFIANCGMARTYAYLMDDTLPLTDDGIFRDVSATIRRALEQVHADHSREPTGIARFAYAHAVHQCLQRTS